MIGNDERDGYESRKKETDGLRLNPKDCIMDDKQPSCLPVILASKRFNGHPVARSS